MRRTFLIALQLCVLLALSCGVASAAGPDDYAGPRTSAAGAPYVCVPSLIWRSPELCPSYGPGTTAYRIASIRLPDPLPALPVTEIPQDDEDKQLLPHVYAHVKTLPLNVYRHPMEAAMGLPPVRTMLSGDWWLSLSLMAGKTGDTMEVELPDGSRDIQVGLGPFR